MGNYCCEVPVGQDETVYVYAAKGVKILYDPLRVYKVRGAFEAGPDTDRTHRGSLLRGGRARGGGGVGGKIFKMGGAAAPGSDKKVGRGAPAPRGGGGPA